MTWQVKPKPMTGGIGNPISIAVQLIVRLFWYLDSLIQIKMTHALYVFLQLCYLLRNFMNFLSTASFEFIAFRKLYINKCIRLMNLLKRAKEKE